MTPSVKKKKGVLCATDVFQHNETRIVNHTNGVSKEGLGHDKQFPFVRTSVSRKVPLPIEVRVLVRQKITRKEQKIRASSVCLRFVRGTVRPYKVQNV